MRTIIFSICADEGLLASLEAVATEKEFGTVGHADQYIQSAGDAVDLPLGRDVSNAIAFVCLDGDLEAGLNTVKALEKVKKHQVQVIAAGSTRNPDDLLRIMGAGVSSFLPLPATTEDIIGVLGRVSDQRVALNNRKGGVFLFMGASGGIGTTTIASHVAVALAKTPGTRVLLVDLHKELGHVAIYLGVKNSGHTFDDVVAGFGSLDSALLDSLLVKHESGLSILCSPERYIHGAKHFDSKSVQRAIEFLRNHYDYIIFDGHPASPDADAVAAVADKAYMVASAEVASLRDLTRYVDHFGKDPERFQVVVTNDGKSAVTASHVSSTCGLPVIARFSQVDGAVATAINAGRLISRDVKSFHEPLSEILLQIGPAAVVATPKSGLFGWRKR